MDIQRIEIEKILREGEDVVGKLLENQDLFAMRFATWALCDPDAQALRATKCPLGQLLDRYKSRPFIDYSNTQNQ